LGGRASGEETEGESGGAGHGRDDLARRGAWRRVSRSDRVSTSAGWCSRSPPEAIHRIAAEVPMALTLTTPAFGTGQEIPSKYTCEGVDDSPEVQWSGAPANTKSFALIVDDPDAPDPKAPKMVWVHWVLY